LFGGKGVDSLELKKTKRRARAGQRGEHPSPKRST